MKAVSPIFQERRGKRRPYMVILLVVVAVLTLAGTAFAGTGQKAGEPQSERASGIQGYGDERGISECVITYEGPGGFLGLRKERATVTVQLPIDLSQYTVRFPVPAVLAIARAAISDARLNGEVRKVVLERVVCPLLDGEIEFVIRAK